MHPGPGVGRSWVGSVHRAGVCSRRHGGGHQRKSGVAWASSRRAAWHQAARCSAGPPALRSLRRIPDAGAPSRSDCRFAEAERVHARWAMAATAGILAQVRGRQSVSVCAAHAPATHMIWMLGSGWCGHGMKNLL
eukprot:364493-Chlamydomonas_euryale.AAC.9